MRAFLLLASALLMTCEAANAADNGFYLGASVGNASLAVDDIDALTNADFKGDDTGFKAIAGFRPLDWLGFELNYVDFGNPEDEVAGTRIETDGNGVSGFVVGFLAFGPFDVFAKVGGFSWKTDLGTTERDGTDLAYGVGAQFRFLSLAVRAEYELFDMKGIDDANMVSLGLTYTFL